MESHCHVVGVKPARWVHLRLDPCVFSIRKMLPNGDFLSHRGTPKLPSGKHTKSYLKLPIWFVDLPIINHPFLGIPIYGSG